MTSLVPSASTTPLTPGMIRAAVKAKRAAASAQARHQAELDASPSVSSAGSLLGIISPLVGGGSVASLLSSPSASTRTLTTSGDDAGQGGAGGGGGGGETGVSFKSRMLKSLASFEMQLSRLAPPSSEETPSTLTAAAAGPGEGEGEGVRDRGPSVAPVFTASRAEQWQGHGGSLGGGQGVVTETGPSRSSSDWSASAPGWQASAGDGESGDSAV